MRSPWWWFEHALDGSFGRKLARIVAAAVFALVALSVVWHAPGEWALHGFLSWKTHELDQMILPWLHSLSHVRVQYPTHPVRAPVRSLEHSFATLAH